MKPNWKTLFLLTTCCTLGLMTSVRAQITPDNSLGAESSTLGQPNQAINGIPINQIDQINGGARRGGNLFHSFGEFNVNAGRGAYFSNPAGIANILTRVTGVNRSNILGTLGVLGNANLFLINPNGIFFGPNARLDVRGSFLGSSANSLLFDNGFEFSATNPIAPPLLTVNIPIGLRFRDNPGNITNQSVRSVVQNNTRSTVGLQVSPGKSLALVGGNVSLEQGGSLTAAGGRIELGGLAGAGTVGLETNGDTFKLNFPANNLSNVSLADNAQVTVRSNGGGDIAVNANIFTGRNGGQLVAGVEGIATRNGGDIIVNSNDISFDGVSSNGFISGIFNQVRENGRGNAGDINITTQNLSLTNGAEITASTFGMGDAGNVKIQASDISFDGVGSTRFPSGVFSTVQGNAVGNGGSIDISTKNLSVTNGAQVIVSTFAQGNAGTIKIQASDISLNGVGSTNGSSGIFSTVRGNLKGNAGGIDISTGTLSLTNGAIINASTFATGNAGRIKIQASDTIKASGVGSNRVISSIVNNVQQNATGNAGGIDISTKNLFFTDGAEISASTFGQGNAGSVKIQASDISFDSVGRTGFASGIFSVVQDNAIGNAGGIDITTGKLSLTNGAVLSASTSNGNAGNVTINASDRVSFAGLGSNNFGSGVYSLVESRAIGNAGNIIINAASIFLDDRAVLRATNLSNGFAGDITLNARDQVSITNNSTISSEGNLGRIFIGSQSGRTDGLSLIPNIINIENSTLSTTNNRTGSAGDITLNARDQVSITNSTVNTTNNTTGFAGDISLNARNQVSIDRSTIESTGRLGRIFIGQSINNAPPFVPSSININNSTLRTTNSGTTVAGDIALNARDQISLNQSRIESNGNFGRIFIGKNDIYGDRTSSPRVVRLEGSSLNTTNQSITGARNTPVNSGNVSIDAIDSILLNNRSFIQAFTQRRGNAGDVTLRTENGDISLAGNSNIFSTVESGGMGNAGKIDVITRNLSLTDSSQLLTSVSARQQGNAGNITVQASGTVKIAGRKPGGNPSGIFSNVLSGASGNGGNITINAGSIFTDDGLLTTTNAGTGSAGDISLKVGDAIALTNGSVINSSISGIGNAGNISLQVGDAIALANSSQIRSVVEPGGEGIGGDINIRGRSLTLTGGSQIATALFREGNGLNGGKGRAGNIEINASDFVDISGFNPVSRLRSGIFASAETGSTGPAGSIDITTGAFRLSNSGIVNAATANGNNAGNITINAKTFAITDGGQVTVASQGQGQGGNLSITGNSLTLDRGVLNASTASGDGGNINLRLRNFIRLRNESLISASAGGNGNGGNITINSPFIIAFPRNNDIIANAGSGSGGQVTINATLFGIAPLSAEDLRRLRPDDLDPRQLPTSDITAISRDNPSLSLPVQVTSPDVDPSRGLVELPEAVTDPTQKVAENPCRQGIGNEFLVTGRGGLPTTPNETLSSNNVRVDLLQPVASSGNSRSATRKPVTTVTATRVPAQGWIFNDKGQVVLTAYDPTNTGSQRSFSTAAACPAR